MSLLARATDETGVQAVLVSYPRDTAQIESVRALQNEAPAGVVAEVGYIGSSRQ